MDPNVAWAQLSLTSIKTPQLIGIVAGVCVFCATVTAVGMLLYYSGTFGRLASELSEGKPLALDFQNTAAALEQTPLLYDHLLLAANTLPTRPSLPTLRAGRVTVRQITADDFSAIAAVSDGRAVFDESAYDPLRVWSWFLLDGLDDGVLPYQSLTAFTSAFLPSDDPNSNSSFYVIEDNEVRTVIGMIGLTNNHPRHLTIQIDGIWITPAYQGKKRAHEAVLLMLQYLFEEGYRRITMEIDLRNVVAKKFAERCGFRQEAVLRKHRIQRSRNRDSALYSLLNSDWEEVEAQLKKLLGLPLRPVMHKIGEIERAEDAVPPQPPTAHAHPE